MNNTRIRYKEVAPSILRSRRYFTTSDGVEVYVELDTVTMTYNVVESTNGGILLSGGDTINLAVLKIQSKEGLASLGVSFAEERRDRANTQSNEASPGVN